MLYILETNLSDNKSVFFALADIHGIGKHRSSLICKKLGFSVNLKIQDLTQEQAIDILRVVESLDILLNNDLRKFRSLTLKNLVNIKSFRGLRRIRGLPVRGQRTHTNARSSKRQRRS